MRTESFTRRGIAAVLSSVTGLLLIASVTQAASAGVFDLKVVDEQGRPLPCRVMIRPRGGECVVPEEAVTLKIGPDRWFVSPGTCEVEVPGGPLTLRVEHGLEYVRFKQDVQVSEPKTDKTVRLKRWINMNRRGYLSGENHIHVGSVPLAAMLAAEGLDFGTSLTWWNGPARGKPIPPDARRVCSLCFADRCTPSSIFDAELEHAWGAAYLQNLPQPMPLVSERGRPNLDYIKHAVEAGGTAHYQGGWSREVGLDALLGYVHVVNICNNEFHLHRFLPRSRYSNLLEVPGFPTYPGTQEGMMRMNTDTYYRLLNWGLRLAAGAGTACGVKQNPVGFNRTYVRVPADASLDQFNKAWAAGQNFVTNGPMLLLKTDTGQRPGDTIEFGPEGGRVGLNVSVTSEQALTAVEILVNGRLVKSFDPTDEHEFTGSAEVEIARGSWIAARATARDDLLNDEELALHTSGDERARFPERPCRLRFAHTSPIYVTLDGRSTAVRESIEEGLQMLDRFEAFARENADEKYLPGTFEAVNQAREVLSARLEDTVR